MNKIIKQILRGGGKTISYLLAALFALAVVQSAQAAMNWTGNSNGDIWNMNNYSGSDKTYSFYFNSGNLAGNKNTIVYLSKDIKGAVKIGTDTKNARYRGYQFTKGSWQLHGKNSGDTIYSIDNSGGNASDNSNFDKDRIVVGCHWKGQAASDATLRMHAINVKTRKILVGSNVGSSKGTLILDDQNNNGNQYHGPVTITLAGATNNNFDKEGNDFQLYNGRVESTAATVTIPGVLNMGYSDNASTELTINSGTWKTARLWMSRNNNNVSKLYVKGGLLQMTGSDDNGWITVGTTSAMSTNYVEVSGGTVDCSNGTAFRLGGAGNADAWSEMLLSGGTVKCRDFYVGDASSARLTMTGGTLDASPGWVYFAKSSDCAADESCELNVNGGTIFTKKFTYGNGAAPATLNLNGGTLKAAENNAGFIAAFPNLTVNVGASGAIFDTNAKSIEIGEPLNAVASTTGGLSVTGGGSATFTAMGDIAGAFTVGENTTLHWFDQDGIVSNYTVSAINIGPGATLYLDADATGCDTFAATTTNITATAENPAKIKLILTSIPAPTEKFALFEIDDADKITVEAETPAGAHLEVEKTYEDGVVSYSILAREYTWNDGTSGANWSAADKWLLDSAPATWADNNIAVFATAGDSVALDSNVTAVKLDFQADANVAAGGGTLTVPSVSVVPSVSATISAPTAGTLEKTGTGTLTLASARSAQTTVTEGTLALTAGNDAVTTANLTLGTDPDKPVVLDYGGNELSGNWKDYMTAGMDITLTNGTFSTTQNPGWWHSSMPNKLTVAKDAEMTTTANFSCNVSGDGSDVTNYVTIVGGKLKSTKDADNQNWIMQNSRGGTLVFNVTDGGLLSFNHDVYALVCRDSSTASDTPSLFFNIVDSTFRVGNNKSFRLGYDANNKEPLNVTGVFAATNSVIDVGYGIYIGNNTNGLNLATGSYTADFENCVITARQIAVYQDRQQNAVRFNNTRFVLNADRDYWLETSQAFETMGEGGTAIKPVTIDAGGLVLDSNGFTGALRADPQGAGAITKVGKGTLNIKWNQTATSPLVVSNGTVAVTSNVTNFNRSISVASGATLSFAAAPSTTTPYATASSFAFASGSTLAIPATTAKGKYKLFTLSSGTFESNPLANATVTGLAVPYTITADGDTVYLNIAHDYTLVNNGGVTALTVGADSGLCGVGGAKLSALAFGENGKLTLDPIKTPVSVSAAPTFAEGAKIALTDNYAAMSLGRIVLLTWTGEATLPENLNSLFDSASIASGATFAVTAETAPNGTSTQLVLTVGDYENDAKEIRILPVGDSITQGVSSKDKGASGQNDNPQYRTDIAARLAANGYKPKMFGVWKRNTLDAAGITQPNDWVWHSGISAERIVTGGERGGVQDNMHVYLDIAGDVNAITFLIGTNDIGSGGKTGAQTYEVYTNLIFTTAVERPNAKIFGSTILDRNESTSANHNNVVAFNTLLKADYAAGNLPPNYVLLDLFEDIPLTTGAGGNFLSDNLHMNWAGCSVAAEKFAEAIMTALPLTGAGAISGNPDPAVTDVPQTALCASNTVPAAYREGMTHIFTIDAANAANGFTSAPYTTTNSPVSVNRNVTKAGYYMELVRKGTNRRRYVWVDFDATGKTLDEIDFPWDGADIQFVAEKLHVYSNDPYVHIVEASDDTVTGIIEGTWHNYKGDDKLSGVPAEVVVGIFGWNDTLGSSSPAGYGCFQAHRILSGSAAEVLFAWNKWGGGQGNNVDDIGIGTFAKSTTLGESFTMDYTYTAQANDGTPDTISASAYQVRHVEIWAAVDMPAETVHGKWIGGGGANMSNPVNWDDGIVPGAGDALDFSLVTSATTINGDIDATFGAVTMGTGVITFTGTNMAATSFRNTAKITVGANSTVTLDGDLVFDGVGQPVSGDAFFIVNKVDANGAFIVTGTVRATDVQNIKPVIAAGSGYIVLNGIVIPAGKSLYSTLDVNTQKWVFGPGGITTTGSGGTIWCLSNKANDCWIYPYTNDFTVSAWTVVREAIVHHELNTTGYGDGQPHTITLDAGFADTGAVYLTGTGKVVVNYVPKAVGGKGAYSGNVTVQDSVTLAINADKKLTTGTTTFAAGTTLEVPSTGVNMGAIAFSGTGTVTLKVSDASLADGEYTLVTSTSDLPTDVLTRFAVSANTASETFLVTLDNRTLRLLVGSREAAGSLYVWTGKAGDGSAGTTGNWLAGEKPTAGANVFIPATSGTLDFGAENLSLSSITFGYGSDAVTIDGENAITGVTAITNLSSASHTINVPVYFAGDIQVKQAAMAETGDLSKAHITFAGGAYAAQGCAIENGNTAAVYSRCMFGKYYLYPAANNPWIAQYQGSSKRSCVAADSELHITYAGKLTELYVGRNAKVFVGDLPSLDGRLMYNMGEGGEMVVTNLTLTGSGDKYLSYNQGTSNPGTFKFNSVTNSMTGNWFYLADSNAAAKHTIYIGEGGLNFLNAQNSAAYCIGRNSEGNSETIRPWYSDFTIEARSTDDNGLAFNRDVTFCTDDENNDGRTITINAKTRAYESTAITVSGSGTVEKNGGCNNSAAPAIVVTGTATLAIKPDAGFGESTMTVHSGATLKVNGSGTVVLNGDLTLADCAKLEFNFTNRVDAPVLDINGDVSSAGEITVSLSGVRPRAGTYTLTSGGKFKWEVSEETVKATVTKAADCPEWVDKVGVGDDGNIYVEVLPKGLIFLIQ